MQYDNLPIYKSAFRKYDFSRTVLSLKPKVRLKSHFQEWFFGSTTLKISGYDIFTRVVPCCHESLKVRLKPHFQEWFFGSTTSVVPCCHESYKVRLKPHFRERKGYILHSNLPHISQNNFYQFITFRTHESTDDYLLKLSSQNLKTKELQYSIDKYLDTSNAGVYLNGKVLQITKEYLLNIEKSLCEIVAFSIMPNHIHLLLIQHTDISKIVQHIKGGLSFLINKELKKKGTFWQKDYFDKAIRDEEHFLVTLKYIENNALKAGLKDADERFCYNLEVRL